MSTTTLSDADYAPIFKKHYFKLGDNLYNTFDNVYSLLKKTYNFGGASGEHPISVTFGGGVGSSSTGILPDANNTSFIKPVYTAKRMYARIKIDQFTIDSSNSSEHAFIKAIDQETTGKLKSFNRNVARAFFNDGTAVLGQFSGSQAGTATAPVVTIINTGNYRYRRAHFEKGDYVNVNTDAAVFEITAVNHATRAITLSRLSGSLDLTAIGAGDHEIYMQNSKDADPYGLMGIVLNSSHYGVTEEFRYEPFEIDAASAPLETEMLTELIEAQETDTDQAPSHIVCSPTQYRKYLALLEDQKRYPVPVEIPMRGNSRTSKDLVARVSYSGIQYVGAQGSISVMKNKYVRDDMLFTLNTNEIEVAHVTKSGWAQRDGTIFMRMVDVDSYEARYRCYMETKINPFHVGYIKDLAV
jgi:hypothetical protein